jgi:hypothetical protein
MEYMNRKERDSIDYMYENESVSDLVTLVSVAVLADDDEYDYYLMKVTKVPFQLERVENDDFFMHTFTNRDGVTRFNIRNVPNSY